MGQFRPLFNLFSCFSQDTIEIGIDKSILTPSTVLQPAVPKPFLAFQCLNSSIQKGELLQ